MADGRDGNLRGCAVRIPICARGNCRKRNGGAVEVTRNLKTPTITRCQQIPLSRVTAAPDWSNCVDDMSRWKVEGAGRFGITGFTAVELTTFFQKTQSTRTVNSTVDSATAQQASVRGVDDRIDRQLDNVALMNGDLAHPHILNTPKWKSGIGAFSAADRLKPITSRVFLGSMIPSSHNRAEA